MDGGAFAGEEAQIGVCKCTHTNHSSVSGYQIPIREFSDLDYNSGDKWGHRLLVSSTPSEKKFPYLNISMRKAMETPQGQVINVTQPKSERPDLQASIPVMS